MPLERMGKSLDSDKLKLTGQNLGRVFNSRCGDACPCHGIIANTF
jgi:hypothetical protein